MPDMLLERFEFSMKELSMLKCGYVDFEHFFENFAKFFGYFFLHSLSALLLWFGL